jgi:hypothetical protein
VRNIKEKINKKKHFEERERERKATVNQKQSITVVLNYKTINKYQRTTRTT